MIFRHRLSLVALSVALTIPVTFSLPLQAAGFTAGPLLATEPAGVPPTPLAPDLLSTEFKSHGALSFTPDGDEAVWSAFYRDSQRIFISRLEDGEWSLPEIPDFSTDLYCGGPIYMDNGQSILFTSERALPGGSGDTLNRIWITRRNGTGWSEPELFTSANGDIEISSQITRADNGDLLFTARTEDRAHDLFVMRKSDRDYGAPAVLTGEVNTTAIEGDPWVDPQQRFLLHTGFNKPDSFGSADLFLSIRQSDGSWGAGLNLGALINTDGYERFASIAPDGRTLTFVRAAGPGFPSTDHSFYRTDFETILNILAYGLKRECKAPTALTVFQLAAELYPESWNTWDSLADGYKHVGNRARAVECYEKALELNPDNESSYWGLKLIDRALLDIAASTDVPLLHAPGVLTDLAGPYLGQTPPGKVPEVFAPGIVSICGRFEYNPAFTPDGDELYFSTNYGLLVSRQTDNGWTAPEPAGIRGFEPHITADGKRMFIGRGHEIWLLDRIGEGWGNDRLICPGMRPYTDKAGNLYVTDLSGEGINGTLAVLHPQGDGFGELVPLPTQVNEPVGGAHPLVSAKGDILIFDSYRTDEEHPNEFGDLFISRRQADGDWSPAVRLPDWLNTPGENICATFSPDERYLFFSGNNDMYWVRADAIPGW
ncbi:MAG: tetratricopeptide repeat protein [bacterium]|nr:tetratricopeptide repeat protein [bacterium]